MFQPQKTIGTIMIKQNTLMSLILVGGLLIPATSFARLEAPQPPQSRGYQWLMTWADQLRGISFNHQRYNAYCNRYSSVAVTQAKRRISEQCTNFIRTPNSNLRNRWGSDHWTHYGWCHSVPARVSKLESRRREGGLKNCFNNRFRLPSKAQTRAACLANDMMHKKAARGDYNYIRKCLDAGVSANVREDSSWTPLHSAARNGRLQVVQLLLQRRAGC